MPVSLLVASQLPPQFLVDLAGVHIRLHQFAQLLHIACRGLELLVDGFQPLTHDDITVVEHQMLHPLAQGMSAVFHLKATTQLIVVDGKTRCQLADVHIGMLGEIGFGTKTGIG